MVSSYHGQGCDIDKYYALEELLRILSEEIVSVDLMLKLIRPMKGKLTDEREKIAEKVLECINSCSGEYEIESECLQLH